MIKIEFSGDNISRCFFKENCGIGMNFFVKNTRILHFSTKEKEFNHYLEKIEYPLEKERISRRRWLSPSEPFDLETISLDKLCHPMHNALKASKSNKTALYSSIKIEREDRTLVEPKGMIDQTFVRILGKVIVSKLKGEKSVSTMELFGGQVLVDQFVDQFRKALSRAQHRATLLLDAQRPPKEEKTVILSPELTGLFVHEAVGHAAEGDIALAGSFLSNFR